MKCDELMKYGMDDPTIGDDYEMYRVADVDAAIDELKREHHRERHEYIEMLAQLKAKLEYERRWRKFSEEKPNEDTWCIVFHEGEIDTDHYMRFTYNKKCDFALYGNKVTHWMPLPSAPKEADK